MKKPLDRAKIAKLRSEGKSGRAIAKEMGVSKSGVNEVIANLPECGHFPPPVGFFAKATSTLFDADGTPKLQWVKANLQQEEQSKQLIDAIKGAFTDTPKVALIPAPARVNSDLLTVYPFGDPHIGMYAWKAETGTDFDLEVAELNMQIAMKRLVDSSPPSEQAIIINVGDFFHGDSTANRTLKSGHVLDIDTRWPKVLRVGVRIMRSCIEAALLKHATVRVINEIGNHDEHTSQMLTVALALLYEANPRVTFDDGPGRFHYHIFGKNLIGVTHGDQTKPESLGEIMAADKPVDWGSTEFRVWYTGHIHTRRVFELRGCMVESFRTLAGRDSWTAGMGYRSGRDSHAIVLHRTHGEIERHRIDISQIE